MTFNPSPEQSAFINWAKNGKGSCVLEAVAGAGKTTTIIEAAKSMKGQVAFLAYNKKIADKIADKIKGVSNLQAGTVHSFGLRALSKLVGKPTVDGYKVANIVEKAIIEHSLNQFRGYGGAIVKLVSYAKQRALGIIDPITNDSAWYDIISHFDVLNDVEDETNSVSEFEIINMARAILIASNKETKIIDFDDMVYLPVLLRAPFFRFDAVMVDEAQDTNPARRALVRAVVKPNGRVIAVGDRHQAIYGFTGADNDSLAQIRADFDAIEMPLTTSFRCPKNVVSFARQWVSHISSADGAMDGSISEIEIASFRKLTKETLNGESVVLCRLTAPIVSLAFSLIRNKIPCKVEGREIGNGLKKLVRRWKVKETADLRDRLSDYRDRETTRALAKKLETKAQQIDDQVETLYTIIDAVNESGSVKVSDVVAAIDSMFEDNAKGILTLSTIHKSKGREWQTVYWLDRAGTCPSKWARQAWQKDQEINLMYVAATRAKANLIEVVC